MRKSPTKTGLGVGKGVALLLGAALAMPMAGQARDVCDIRSDTVYYYEHLDQAILLMAYKDALVHAVDGKIRCMEETAQARLNCQIDGPSEMLIRSERGQYVVTTTTQEMHEVHISARGGLTCAMSSDFK